MSIEGISSYNESLTDEEIQFFDTLGVEWRGRNVFEIQEDVCLKSSIIFTKVYQQTSHTNPEALPELKSQMVQVFKELFEDESTEEDEYSSRLYRYDPISGTYQELTAAEKNFFKKIAKSVRKAGRWVRKHPVQTAVIVAAVVVAAVVVGPLVSASAAAGGAVTAALEQNRKKEEESKKDPKMSSSSSSSPPDPSPAANNPAQGQSGTASTTSSSLVSPDPFPQQTIPSFNNFKTESPGSASPFTSTIPSTTLTTDYKTISSPSSTPFPETSLVGGYPKPSVPPSFTTHQPSTHSALPGPNYNLQSIPSHQASFQSPYPAHLSPVTTTFIPNPYNMFPIPRISDPVSQATEARPVQARISTIEHPLDFSLGMAKGLLKGGYVGIKEFGPGLISTVQVLSQATWNLVTEPVDTISNFNQNVVDCIDYIKSHSTTETLGAVIPEFRELLETWDHIEDGQRGEKAGVIIGKYGVDILVCNEAVKGIKAFQELKRTNQLMQFATQALQRGNQVHLNQVSAILAKEGIPLVERQALLENTILSNEALKKEFAEFVENSKLAVKPNVMLPLPGKLSSQLNVANIRELIKAGTETPLLAKELGFTNREIAHLTKTGTLDKTVGSAFENIISDKAMLESLEKFKAAEDFLKPYRGQYLSEIQARELIHQTGVKSYPRPEGIPENFVVKISNNGAGIKYIDPQNIHISVRVMPGKPHSPFPHQREPYVIHTKHGNTLDKFGNIVSSDLPAAHIPVNEFNYRP